MQAIAVIDPQRAVPFAGVAHGVVVRAEHQAGRPRPLAFVAAADVADRVEMRAHAGLAHPGQDQVGRLPQFLLRIDAGRCLPASSEIAASSLIRRHDLFAERCIFNGVSGTHLDELSICSRPRQAAAHGNVNRYKFGAAKNDSGQAPYSISAWLAWMGSPAGVRPPFNA